MGAPDGGFLVSVPVAADPAALHVQRYGQGAPVVLLHGWGMNQHVFDTLGARLAAHHTVIAVDLPGHGASAWTGGTQAALLASLARLVPAGAALVGWSLGGQLALQLAAEATRDIRRLVLISSTPRFVQDTDWPWGLSPNTLREFSSSLADTPQATLEAFLELTARGGRGAAETLVTLRETLEHHGRAAPAALAAGLRLLATTDLRALARDVAVPTLLICGRLDRITPPEASHALAALLPQARLRELPRAGHAPLLSHPAEVAAAILQFLTELPE